MKKLNPHTLVGGQRLSNVHDPSKCVGQYCTIHNFSNHHMVDWPQNWRMDRGIMERICPHGIGHPDPDEINYNGAHGCDGCCILTKYTIHVCQDPETDWIDMSSQNELLSRLRTATVADSAVTLYNLMTKAADEIERLHSLVSELLPYMLNDMEQGLALSQPPFDVNHCKNSLVPCPDCTWFQDATLWKKRVDAGEFKDYNI